MKGTPASPAILSPEARPARGEEGAARLTGHRPRQQRLAGTGRADQQNAARNPSADRGKAARLFQEVDDFTNFVLRLIHAGDVVERDLDVLEVDRRRRSED